MSLTTAEIVKMVKDSKLREMPEYHSYYIKPARQGDNENGGKVVIQVLGNSSEAPPAETVDKIMARLQRFAPGGQTLLRGDIEIECSSPAVLLSASRKK